MFLEYLAFIHLAGWTEHFVVRISEGQSRRIRCMAHKCNTICDEAVVRNLLVAKDPAVAVRFESYLLESYIEDNSKVKWCPSIPHCGNAIFVEEGSCREVQCTCGLQFCFSCLSEAHSPCSCMMWDLWLKKLRSESENFDWITVHTKSCPKCHKVVEKDGGCNLVTCICGQSFWYKLACSFHFAAFMFENFSAVSFCMWCISLFLYLKITINWANILILKLSKRRNFYVDFSAFVNLFGFSNGHACPP